MAGSRSTLWSLVLAAVLVSCAPARAAERPATVPALARWSARPGEFVLRRGTRVVATQRALRGEARTLARDLGLRTSTKPPRRRDIVLQLAAGLPPEGYRLSIDRRLVISAAGAAGAYYGGRTALQLLGGDRRAPRGTATDAPRYAERGLMVDVGRQFFTVPWLAARIRALGALKLNLLHLHLSDDQGFRIASRTHPEAVTEPALSYDDVRRLLRVAARHHVTLVPEIDAPGHLTAALRAHPELQLANVAGARQPDKLDVTNPAARRFYLDLVGEYLELFPGAWWHMGADEYLGIASTPLDYELVYPQLAAFARAKYGGRANGKDAVLDFVAEAGALVRSRGRSLRVWSDGIGGGSGAVGLDPATTVEWWENMHSPGADDLTAAGHRVLNAGWWPTYYVTGGPLEGLRTPIEQMYEEWRPARFEGPYTTRWFGGPHVAYELSPDNPRLVGATLNVWNDVPGHMSEQAIAAGIAPRLRVLADKAWGAPPLAASYAEWRRLTDAP